MHAGSRRARAAHRKLLVDRFYRALGKPVGASMVEEDLIPMAGELMKSAEAKGVKFFLPSDVMVADKFGRFGFTTAATSNAAAATPTNPTTSCSSPSHTRSHTHTSRRRRGQERECR